MYTGLTDTEIINEVLGGEQKAFATLVNRYKNFVFTLALRFTRHREDAEEVAQDVFVKTYRSLYDFRGTSKFSTWLYTIVFTTSVTFLRRKKLVTIPIEDDNNIIQLENKNSGFMADGIEQKSKIGHLNEAINMLPANDAQIITLFYKGEQSLEEIGQILGIDPNTVKVRLHRARQRLKERLEKHLNQEISVMYEN